MMCANQDGSAVVVLLFSFFFLTSMSELDNSCKVQIHLERERKRERQTDRQTDKERKATTEGKRKRDKVQR